MTECRSTTLTFDEWDELNFPRPTDNDFDRVVERAISRRGFLGSLVVLGSGAAVMGSGMFSPAPTMTASGAKRNMRLMVASSSP